MERYGEGTAILSDIIARTHGAVLLTTESIINGIRKTFAFIGSRMCTNQKCTEQYEKQHSHIKGLGFPLKFEKSSRE